MIRYLSLFAILLAASSLLAGCGKGGATGGKSLDGAPPEIKTLWDQAVAADKSNDYYNAAVAYNQLVAMESKMSPKQFEVVVEASRTLMTRMRAAADGGDAAAKDAFAKLMAAQRGR